jgi:hypothetical protein
MPTETTCTRLGENFASVLEQVGNQQDVILVRESRRAVRAASWVLAFMALSSCPSFCGVLYDWQEQGIRVRAVVISSPEFTDTNIVKLAGEFAASSAGSRVATLWLFTNESDAQNELGWSGAAHPRYEDWLGVYTRAARKVLPAAEVISTKKGAVLRIRDVGGRVPRRVLRGVDPTLYTVEGIEFEVLDVRFPGGPPNWQTAHPPTHADFYVRSSSTPSIGSAEAVTRRLLADFVMTDCFARIQSGSWFVGDFGFGPLDRFAPDLRPPSKTTIHGLTQTSCGTFGTDVSCTELPAVLDREAPKTGNTRRRAP